VTVAQHRAYLDSFWRRGYSKCGCPFVSACLPSCARPGYRRSDGGHDSGEGTRRAAGLPVSRCQWNDGYGADSGPSRGIPFRSALGRGCVKTSARFHTSLLRSLLRGLRAFRVEKIAKNLALLDRLQNVAEFLHGLDTIATCTARPTMSASRRDLLSAVRNWPTAWRTQPTSHRRWPDRRRVWGRGCRERTCFLGTRRGGARQASQLLPRPLTPVRSKLRRSAIQSQAASLRKSARSSP
jgi:hypothetical protein